MASERHNAVKHKPLQSVRQQHQKIPTALLLSTCQSQAASHDMGCFSPHIRSLKQCGVDASLGWQQKPMCILSLSVNANLQSQPRQLQLQNQAYLMRLMSQAAGVRVLLPQLPWFVCLASSVQKQIGSFCGPPRVWRYCCLLQLFGTLARHAVI
jgi:hypothetical protein